MLDPVFLSWYYDYGEEKRGDVETGGGGRQEEESVLPMESVRDKWSKVAPRSGIIEVGGQSLVEGDLH